MKNVKAIVYTSNTGYSALYAKLLGEKTELPVYSLKEASLKEGTEVIYIGWLMASFVKDYNKAAKEYKVCAVIGVGMGETGTQLKEVRENNKVPENVPVFVLQGGFDMNKLSGIYKLMMKLMVKKLKKDYEGRNDLSEGEKAIVDMLYNGGNYVDEKHLSTVLEWYNN
ncbi:MAG: hypothetical protein IJF69_02295 [Clostridia bacterium]|nr:hypothetical protein [Clostridia bacterium]